MRRTVYSGNSSAPQLRADPEARRAYQMLADICRNAAVVVLRKHRQKALAKCSFPYLADLTAQGESRHDLIDPKQLKYDYIVRHGSLLHPAG